VTGLLLSKGVLRNFGEDLAAAAREAGLAPLVLHLPEDPAARLAPADLARIEIAYLTRDIRFSEHYRTFGDTVVSAPNLKWVHFVSTAADQHPFLPRLVERGVRLTTSAGSNGEPVAQTAICGLLMLARKFPHWLGAQRRRAWEPMRGEAVPRDLRGQTALIVGLGTIGTAIARFCQALGMHVIGVRRSPRRDGDPVDEMHTLAALPQVLARCDWVVLACPYTPQTHRLIHAGTLARLPRGAQLVNVARGAVVDQTALIAALESGQLAGAYLDVFEKEPLPADSPLWELPNVIVTPHNASASSGNDRRAADIFLANLARWARGEPMHNEVAPG
jgi:D-2-hydroxyacid dehydrogenase (NADP+)